MQLINGETKKLFEDEANNVSGLSVKSCLWKKSDPHNHGSEIPPRAGTTLGCQLLSRLIDQKSNRESCQRLQI